MLISVGVGVPVGVLAAWRKGSLARPRRHGVRRLRLLDADLLARASSSSTSSPSPPAGCRCRATSRWPAGPWPFLRHLILPALTLSVVYMALIARMTRASMLGVLEEDYVRTAFAKGLAAARRAGAPRAQERLAAGRHDHRHRLRAADRRRRRDRERVRAARAGPAHRRRHRPARLPGHPGRAARRLRASTCSSTWSSTSSTSSSTRGSATDDGGHRDRSRRAGAAPALARRPAARAARGFVRRQPTFVAGVVVLLADRWPAASWRRCGDGRSAADAAGPAAAAAVGGAVVRLRPLRPRRLHAHAVRRPRLAHGRRLGGAC